MVHLTPKFVKLKKGFLWQTNTFVYILHSSKSEDFFPGYNLPKKRFILKNATIYILLIMKQNKNYALTTKICTQFEPMTCQECTSTILVLADLDSMSLDYLYYII